MAGGSSTPNSRLKTVDRYRKAVKLIADSAVPVAPEQAGAPAEEAKTEE